MRKPAPRLAQGVCGNLPRWGGQADFGKLARGGVKGGVSVGATDDLGSAAVTDRMHVKHLHSTILNQLGLDPNHLSYFFNGLDQKLVGVEGAEPIRKLIG